MTIEEAKSKLVSLALSQVGYTEGANNWNKYADDPGITKLYGWNPQNQPWCCVFVNYCFLATFGYDIGSRLTYGGTAACNASANLFKQNAAWKNFPEVGDQAFFFTNGGINHTGIVVSVDGTAFVTVEGNYSDKVSRVNHNVGKGDVAGFGRPDWKIVETETTETTETTTDTTIPTTETTVTQNEHKLELPLLKMSNKYMPYCVLLQALLNCREFACGSADGFYGPKTQAAVNKAQQFYGLEVDGICGPETWAKLLEVG